MLVLLVTCSFIPRILENKTQIYKYEYMARADMYMGILDGELRLA